ncbi:MAG: hypothetical protein RLZZ31_1285 [Actinomycetota bacterium]|jgi:membrane associated rhomboid family serine protease
MVQASVGFQCPECVRGGAKRAPVYRFNQLRRQSQPIVTISLIVINVALWLVTVLNGAGIQGNTTSVSVDLGLVGRGVVFGPNGLEAVGVANGEWWRVFTGGFIHSGIFHLGMNMAILWLLGSQLEQLLGRSRYLGLYIASLVAGSFGVLLISPTSLTVGASGAVFGLMGAALIAQRNAGIDLRSSGLLGLIVINLLITFLLPGISVGGHIGGLVGGTAVGAGLFALDRASKSVWLGTLLSFAATALLFVGCLWAAAR